MWTIGWVEETLPIWKHVTVTSEWGTAEELVSLRPSVLLPTMPSVVNAKLCLYVSIVCGQVLTIGNDQVMTVGNDQVMTVVLACLCVGVRTPKCQ
jgi:hypothetical protein